VIGVTVEFGQPISDRERFRNPSIGGGGLMDIGIYVIQFALMAFGGIAPVSISATGSLMDTGADETASLMLQFGEGKFAQLLYSGKVR
jgi:predicted dehydrogenase